jgi:hypothetical protein
MTAPDGNGGLRIRDFGLTCHGKVHIFGIEDTGDEVDMDIHSGEKTEYRGNAPSLFEKNE